MNPLAWTPRTWIGAAILLLVAVAAIVWLSIDPHRTEAWALLTQVVNVAARLAEGA